MIRGDRLQQSVLLQRADWPVRCDEDCSVKTLHRPISVHNALVSRCPKTTGRSCPVRLAVPASPSLSAGGLSASIFIVIFIFFGAERESKQRRNTEMPEAGKTSNGTVDKFQIQPHACSKHQKEALFLFGYDPMQAYFALGP